MRLPFSSIGAPHGQVRRSGAFLQAIRGEGFAIAVLVMGLALRVIYLDADPDYYAWIGYVTDEGRWLRNARQLALFGHVLDPDRGLHIHLAPLFHLVHTLVLKLLGVSFVTTRLVTALSGCALLVVAWIFLRRFATPQALVVALMLLAFEVDLIAMSRIAIPEMPAMFLQLVAFVVLLTPPMSTRRLLTAGGCLLLAVATKATVLAVVPIFAMLVVLYGGQKIRQRLKSLLMFGVGFCAPVVPVLLYALARRGELHDENLRNSARTLQVFLRPSTLYDIASLPFESTLAPVLNVWGIAACLAFVGWMVSSRDSMSSPAHRCYVASLIWASTYSLVMASLAYFPDRYRIHLLVPLAVNIAAGLTLFQGVGLTGAAETLGQMHATKRLVALIPFGLPTAAFWAPLLASGYHLMGGNATHLRVRMAAVAIALVVTVAVLHRRLQRGRSVLPFVVFPITAAVAWLICDRLGLEGFPFWPAPEHGPWTWMLAVGWLVLLPAWALATLRTPQARSWRPGLLTLAAAVYAVLSLISILPSYVEPQYTMKLTSENLGRQLAGFHGVVGSRRADSLFTANTLRYRSTLGRGGWQPDVLLVVFDAPEPSLDREYRLVTQYDLFISRRYVPPPAHKASLARSRLPVRLYVRR